MRGRSLTSAWIASDPLQVEDAARRIHRYFSVAFPLHVADEEENAWPALRGTDARLDAALDAATAEHRNHAPLIAEVIESAADLVTAPRIKPARALEAAAAALEAELLPRLDAEEREIFPALRGLPAATLDSLSAAFRARRGAR